MRHYVLVCGVLFLSGILIFKNLGNIYLWEDEAETGVLATNVLHYGIPKAWDGRNLIALEDPKFLNSHLVMSFLPWAQYYITALSFFFFGKNTFNARLPFALIGFLCGPLLYLFVLRLLRNKTVALLSLLFLTLSIPFILHIRQCRYYSLIAFFTLCLLYSITILNKLQGKILFVVSTVSLYFSNYLNWIATLSGLLLYFLSLKSERKRFLKEFFLLTIFSIIIILPHIFYCELFKYTHAHHKTISFSNYISSLTKYLLDYNSHIFPFMGFLLLIPLFGIHRYILHYKKELLLPFTVIACNLLLIPFFTFPTPRYTTNVIPLLCFFVAVFINIIFKKMKFLGIIITCLYLFSNILSVIPLEIDMRGNIHRKRLKEFIISPLYFNYLYEITHDYDGPMEGIVKFLKKHGKEEEVVLTNYGHEVIIFYTNMKVAGRINRNSKFSLIMPDYISSKKIFDWFIPRRGFDGYINIHNQEIISYIKDSKKKYKLFEINYPDILWENRPVLQYHKFKTVSNAPRIRIYKVYSEHNK